MAIAKFMKLFASIKQAVKGIRIDYYSRKVFTTLEKTSTSDLLQATNTLFNMYYSIMSQPLKDSLMVRDSIEGTKVDLRLIEFLILPRFMISKGKLLKLAEN